MRMIIGGWIVNVFELLLFFTGLYYVIAGVFSFFRRHALPRAEGMGRFAVIVPAHNEGRVICRLLGSIAECNYPARLIDVFVVADSCTDNTAQTAAAMGAFVITKFSGATCKAAALALGAESALRQDEYDYITVFDADNIVSPGYFTAINQMMSLGYGAAQGRLVSKNPDCGFVSFAYTAWSILEERLGRLAPHNLGLNVKLSGTGYTIRRSVFEKLELPEESLAEDLEMTAALAFMGERTAYVRDAVSFDEKPAEVSDSIRQRIRWAQGIVAAQGKYGLALLRKGRLFDWLSLYGDFLAIFTYVFFCVIGVLSTISIVGGGDFVFCRMWVTTPGYIGLGLYLGTGALCALFALAAERSGSLPVQLAGLLMLFVTWIPAGFIGILRHNKTEWYHTEHRYTE